MTQPLRLSTLHREDIARRALAGAFDKEAEALKKREHKIAKRAYNEILSPAERRAASRMPKYWFSFATFIEVQVLARTVRLMLGEPLPLPASGKDGGYRLGAIKDPALADEIDKLLNAKVDFKQRRDKAQIATEEMLRRISSVKQLAAAWPEGRPYWKHLEGRTADLPAIRTADVNQMLGLQQAA